MTKKSDKLTTALNERCRLRDNLAEEILMAAKDVLDARLRPREGWHNSIRYNAEHRYHMALREYADLMRDKIL